MISFDAVTQYNGNRVFQLNDTFTNLILHIVHTSHITIDTTMLCRLDVSLFLQS